jgi:hypothetical protein
MKWFLLTNIFRKADKLYTIKEGNEISLSNVLKSKFEDVIKMILLNMELEMNREYIDVPDAAKKR